MFSFIYYDNNVLKIGYDRLANYGDLKLKLLLIVIEMCKDFSLN